VKYIKYMTKSILIPLSMVIIIKLIFGSFNLHYLLNRTTIHFLMLTKHSFANIERVDGGFDD
jgi:hypothetical protein